MKSHDLYHQAVISLHPIKKTLIPNVDGKLMSRAVRALSQIDKARYEDSPQDSDKVMGVVVTHHREKKKSKPTLLFIDVFKVVSIGQ